MDKFTNTYCRLCAGLKTPKKLLDLQTDEVKYREIVEKLSRLNARADLDNNILPRTVCLVCITSLNKAFDFVLAIEQAQAALNDIIIGKQIKKETNTESDGDTDSFMLDPSDVSKFVGKITVKIEPQDYEAEPKVETSKTEQNHKENTKEPSPTSLDNIPLAQLNLTWKDFSWQCSYCGTQFPTVEELKTHSIACHNCCNAFRCTDCNIRTLRLEKFLLHVTKHRKHLKLACYMCHTTFQSQDQFNAHKSVHKDAEFICAGCNTTFQCSEELTEHTESYFEEKRLRTIPIKDEICDGLTCLLCKKTFKNTSNLNRHLLIHTDRKRQHRCVKCGKCFLSKQSLGVHMIFHDDTRPYQCEICKFGFKTQWQLRNHIGIHDGQKPYACDQCGRCFRLPKQLRSHKIIHTDSYPYVCSYCNKGFRFKTILNQHIRQHTGVKPYSCETCQKDFRDWPNYNRHMKHRHGTDMAKKKHTPNGVYPVNPATGEVVIHPETDSIEEWKRKMLSQRRPGQPSTNLKKEDSKNCLI